MIKRENIRVNSTLLLPGDILVKSLVGQHHTSISIDWCMVMSKYGMTEIFVVYKIKNVFGEIEEKQFMIWDLVEIRRIVNE